MICLDNCSGIYNKLIKEKSECINDCKRDDIYKYELENQCYKNYSDKANFVNEQIFQLINEIKKTKLENGNDEEIKKKNIKITFTSTKNHKNNKNINKTTII